MISYSDYKLLLKEADAPGPAGAPPSGPSGPAGAGAPPPADLGGPPPGFSGGPPIGGGASGGLPDMGALGGMGAPPTGSAAGLKPSGLKSSNIWDVLEKILNSDSEKLPSKKSDKTSGI